MADFLGGVLSQSDLLNSDNAEISEEVELKKKKQRKVCRSLYYVICVVLVCLVRTSCNKRSPPTIKKTMIFKTFILIGKVPTFNT